jgi:hypothetical protein
MDDRPDPAAIGIVGGQSVSGTRSADHERSPAHHRRGDRRSACPSCPFGSACRRLVVVGATARAHRRLLATGTPGHATIRRVWRTGIREAGLGGQGRHEVAFELDVHPDGGRDYAAKALGLLTEDEEAPLTPGAEVTVRYDPSHHASVVVVGPMVPLAG